MEESLLVESLKETALHLYAYGTEKMGTHDKACADCQNNKKQRERVQLEVTELLHTASSIIASAVSVAKSGMHGHAQLLDEDEPDDTYKTLATKWANEIIAALAIEPGGGN